MDECKNKAYRKGDSCVEEFGIKSKHKLLKAMSGIVQIYKSKTEYSKAEDKFQGKPFACYHQRDTHMTYFIPNWEIINQLMGNWGLKGISVQKQEGAHVSNTPSPAPVDNFSEAEKNLPLVISGESKISSPLARTHPDPIVLQTNTSLAKLSTGKPITVGEEEELSKGYKAIGIWNSRMRNKAALVESNARRMCERLIRSFGGCLEKFKAYVDYIASILFLTGRAPNTKFCAVLFWATQSQVIETVLSGGYGVGEIFSQVSMMSDENELKRQIASQQNEISKVDDAIDAHKSDTKTFERRQVEQARALLSPDDPILKQINEKIDNKYPDGLEKGSRDRLFTSEIVPYLRAQLGFSKDEDDITPPQELSEKLTELRNKKNASIKLLRIAEKEAERQKEHLMGIGCKSVC